MSAWPDYTTAKNPEELRLQLATMRERRMAIPTNNEATDAAIALALHNKIRDSNPDVNKELVAMVIREYHKLLQKKQQAGGMTHKRRQSKKHKQRRKTKKHKSKKRKSRRSR